MSNYDNLIGLYELLHVDEPFSQKVLRSSTSLQPSRLVIGGNDLMPYLAQWVRSVLLVCVLSITSTGWCDELGSGVQAFFDGNNELAVTTLTQVVEQSQASPRAFFFRGRANQRMGDLQAAIADFKHGASL